jgi:chromate reductase
VELVLWEGLRDVPPFDEDLEQGPSPLAVASLRKAIAGADAVLIATPEYNHSIPGQLKTALDWASRPYDANVLRGRPAAVIGASTGMFGAVWAQAETRKILGAIGARVLDAELPVGMAGQADPADHEEALRGLLDDLVSLAEPAYAAAA